MQPTRQLILQYLKEHGEATVDKLAGVLQLTTVTVRHHLDILRAEELVSEPVVRRRTTPGRPQYTFALAPKAQAHFPQNYQQLTRHVLAELKTTDARLVNVIFEGVANRLAAQAPAPRANEAWPKRLDRTVAYLNEHGYVATWESANTGYLIRTCNCPYADLSGDHPELCGMDVRLISGLVGAPVECAGRLAEGDAACAYHIQIE